MKTQVTNFFFRIYYIVRVAVVAQVIGIVVVTVVVVVVVTVVVDVAVDVFSIGVGIVVVDVVGIGLSTSVILIHDNGLDSRHSSLCSKLAIRQERPLFVFLMQ